MRDYREVAQRVLERRDRYVKEQKSRQKRTAAAAGCVSLAVVVGIMAWAGPGPQGGTLLDAPPQSVQDFLPGQENKTQSETKPEIPDQPAVPAPEQPSETEKPSVRETPKTPTSQPAPKKETETRSHTSPSVQKEARVSAAAPMDLTQPGGSGKIRTASSEEAPLPCSSGSDTECPAVTDAPVQVNPVGLGTGQIVYTAVWGGSYLDQDGTMVVLLTQDTPENREAVFQRNPAFLEAQVRFQTADYTLEYLTQVQEDISAAMRAGELPFAVSSALMEAENRVQVRVTSQQEEDLDRIRAFDPQGGAIQLVTPDEIEDLCALPLAPSKGTEQPAETE